MQASLELGPDSMLEEELSLGTLMRELNLKKRPSWLLRRMMNALEDRRRKLGLGWSRPWNKEGLNVFRTHKVLPGRDGEFLSRVGAFLEAYRESLPASAWEFSRELLADPGLMAFVFYHNHGDRDGEHEGLTVSLGRKCAEDAGKRDRLDIILEDRRENGAVDGVVDRLRIYSCPWSEYGSERRPQLFEEGSADGLHLERRQGFYQGQVDAYRLWRDDPARQWSHWSIDYIDYFGPRSFIPRGSRFT